MTSTDILSRMDMTANWMISEAQSIVISGHRDPDQDSIGSQIAMYHVLVSTFPDKDIISVIDPDTVEIVVEGRMSSTFNYINQFGVKYVNEIIDSMSDGNTFDLFVGLDCASYDRLPDNVQKVAKNCRNQLFFDHHPSDDSDRRSNVFNDPTKPSTTALLYEFFKDTKYGKYVVPEEAYNAMYLGLVGDTGNFTYSNTTTGTLVLASEISHGMSVSPSDISNFCRQKSFNELVSSADVINNARCELDNRFIYYVHDNPNDSISDGFSSINNPVDELTKIRGYQIVMTAVAIDENKFRVSLRSSGTYVVNDIAEKYHGGGHSTASGCICTDDELDNLISDLRSRVKSNYYN